MEENSDKSYVFTFSGDDPHRAGKAVRIYGTFESSRQKMFDTYGDHWAFQYSYHDWLQLEQTHKNIGHDIETIIDTL